MRKSLVLGLLAFSAVILSACGKPSDPTETASTEAAQPAAAETAAAPLPVPPADMAGKPLPERLDCLRENGGVLLIGHRGGPTRDYPENAIETLERTLKAGTRAMEVDIQRSQNGVLFLLHDDELDRTTTGTGLAAETPWVKIRELKLKTYSKTTEFSPPTLDATLKWAVANDVLLELDKKREVPVAEVILAVRAAKAENHVFIITYNDAQAAEVHAAAPDLVITASVRDAAHLDTLLKRGVKADRLVAWTGTDIPEATLWKTLAERKVESAFGTLGPRDTSLDDQYWADGDGAEFNKLAADGLPILVTDLTDKVSRQLRDDMTKAGACGF
jgi:glycerophosphoryl diester phosphodiesterase